MRLTIKPAVLIVTGMSVLALALTIIGSSTGHDGLLAAGMIGWFVATCLLFSIVVLTVWAFRKRHEG